MKPRPAEEWMMVFGFTISAHSERKVSVATHEDIQAIQLDAFRAGMRYAAPIAELFMEQKENRYEYATNVAARTSQAILAAADNLKELP